MVRKQAHAGRESRISGAHGGRRDSGARGSDEAASLREHVHMPTAANRCLQVAIRLLEGRAT